MENNEMTIREALAVTKQILDGISVPVGLLEQIGAPLKAASDNIGIMIDSINKAEEAQKDGAGDGVSV